jgi:hypothetical protein
VKDPSDPLLRTVAQLARDEDPLRDEAWDALARGELADDEAARLRALVDEGRAPEGAFEAFRPLDGAERDAIADAVLAKAAKPGAAPAAEVVPLEPRRGAKETASGGAGVGARARKAIVVGTTALVLAAAVGFALVWLRPPAYLPGYALAVEGGISEERVETPTPADPTAPLVLSPKARYRLTLRPEVAVEGVVEVKSFLRRGGSIRAVDLLVERKPNGTVLVPSLRGELFAGAAPGPAELVLAVALASEMPSDMELMRDLGQRASGAVGAARLVSVQVVLGP